MSFKEHIVMKCQSLKMKYWSNVIQLTQNSDCLNIFPEIKYSITEWIICKTFKAYIYHASFTIRMAFKLLKSSHDTYHHVIICCRQDSAYICWSTYTKLWEVVSNNKSMDGRAATIHKFFDSVRFRFTSFDSIIFDSIHSLAVFV